jgi:hypothetical protein
MSTKSTQVATRGPAAVATIPQEKVDALELAYNTYLGALNNPALSTVQRMMLTAQGTLALREALKGPVYQNILKPLMNTDGGFDTDRNPAKNYSGAPYDEDTVVTVVAQMCLLGLPPTGNLFNIISGRAYPRKEGYEKLVNERCRATPKVRVGDYQALGGAAGYVPCTVTIKYQLNDAPEGSEARTFTGVYDCRLTANNKVPVDYLAGKALRKAYRALYAILTGQYLPEADEDTLPGAPAGPTEQAGPSADDIIEAEVVPEAPAPAASKATTAKAPETWQQAIVRMRALADELKVRWVEVEEKYAGELEPLNPGLTLEQDIEGLEEVVRELAKTQG